MEFFRLKKQVNRVRENYRLVQMSMGIAMFFGLLYPPSFIIGLTGTIIGTSITNYKMLQIEKKIKNQCEKN
ncbi:MAG: hypothetical protein IPL26_15730 [Leptospiraceae bacterium]|nr:hypothetical protein [Leptospiraceae bacterium]